MTKEKNYHEAAMKGNLSSDSPLHIAALLGQSDIARELLNQNPQLARQLNSNGYSPLHIASAKGHVEIVKQLLLIDPSMCLALDQDGRTPLHLAAIKGRITVLTELIRTKPEASRVLTGQRDSILHLCVKYNRLDSLKVLMDSMQRDDQFVNWRDPDGNTVLHLAVANKQLEILKFLLSSTAVKVDARNRKGFTAEDILSQGPRDLRDREIQKTLLTIRDSTPKEQISNTLLPGKHKHTDYLGRKRSSLMIVGSLIATVAFQSAISPPGGVWQDEYLVDSNGNLVKNPHNVGMSVMAYRLPIAYGQFMIFNTLAFLSSLSIILLLISGLPLKRRRWMWIQMVITWIAITALTFTYFIALIHMTPDHATGVLYHVTRISILAWFLVMGVVFIGNVIRVILYFLRKYGYIKEKNEELKVYLNGVN